MTTFTNFSNSLVYTITSQGVLKLELLDNKSNLIAFVDSPSRILCHDLQHLIFGLGFSKKEENSIRVLHNRDVWKFFLKNPDKEKKYYCGELDAPFAEYYQEIFSIDISNLYNWSAYSDLSDKDVGSYKVFIKDGFVEITKLF